jgi:hypothetical protein
MNIRDRIHLKGRADRPRFPAGDQHLGFDDLHDGAVRRELRD